MSTVVYVYSANVGVDITLIVVTQIRSEHLLVWIKAVC